MDAQMLSCAQEELAVKKRLVEQIEHMDKQYADNMAKNVQEYGGIFWINCRRLFFAHVQ